MLRTRFAAAILAIFAATPGLTDGIMIHDGYVLTAGPMAKSGAAFFHIMNETDQDDRLIAVASDVAARVELHTHVMTTDGVMQMREIEGGIEVAARSMHMLQRGGDHVMLMGLAQKLGHGDIVTFTLTFENAGDMTVEIPVDLERPAEQQMMHPSTDG